ncbi:PEP-CTERM sorting domain-containing protein [Edaphobacter aggregans]|uniref:PEP-CTERM sorting domain-containing protein n=1 Tax=Edaphobacter aggregans TaxID=570835 RepID=UPI00068A6A4C|nr:PEP-CTERM sorting domain-containing protein [Edaphobacter aggregans]
MRYLSVILALTSFSASVPAVADTISYGSTGSIAPTSLLTANVTGDIIGYFIGQRADHTSVIRMVDVTSGYTSGYFFNNHAAAAGTIANFGSVSAGDVLAFELSNFNSGFLFGTDPSHSPDGINHSYTAAFGGGTLNGVSGLPAGTYVGMEDLFNGGDLDYDDNNFLFTNVGTTTQTANTPEPETLVLLGTGILGVATLLRRRLHGR